MSKKRTKKQKVKLKTKVKETAPIKKLKYDFFGFDVKLIYQDLLKTLAVSGIVVTALLVIYLKLS